MDAVTATAAEFGTALAAPAPFVGLRRGYYGAVCVDPASRFKSYTAIQSQNPSSRRDNERHYRTMSFAELAALPIRELAAPGGCHLFVWTSGPIGGSRRASISETRIVLRYQAPLHDIATERVNKREQPVANVVFAELGCARDPPEDCRAAFVDGVVVNFEFTAGGCQCLNATRHVDRQAGAADHP
jgi:hypothetical protein